MEPDAIKVARPRAPLSLSKLCAFLDVNFSHGHEPIFEANITNLCKSDRLALGSSVITFVLFLENKTN